MELKSKTFSVVCTKPTKTLTLDKTYNANPVKKKQVGWNRWQSSWIGCSFDEATSLMIQDDNCITRYVSKKTF